LKRDDSRGEGMAGREGGGVVVAELPNQSWKSEETNLKIDGWENRK
jgi:hypothetical protein